MSSFLLWCRIPGPTGVKVRSTATGPAASEESAFGDSWLVDVAARTELAIAGDCAVGARQLGFRMTV
jgi:hypothetical protein